jgi:hypothetical protein
VYVRPFPRASDGKWLVPRMAARSPAGAGMAGSCSTSPPTRK